MGYETLIVDQTGAIATITLNRPEARNALDFAMRRELLTALWTRSRRAPRHAW